MSSISQSLTIDPVDLVAQDHRLFIDTNVFMDTDPRRQGLKDLFERIAPAIQQGGSPVVVPTKVTDELARQSSLDLAGLDADRAAAVKKAANALVFVRSAEAAGLVRNDLGDSTNPYADDLFVKLFEAYADRYGMFLLTNDITLLIRINVLGKATGKAVAAGRLAGDGSVECESAQSLHNRGAWKLQKLVDRVENGQGDPKDSLEIAALEASLAEYQLAFETATPSQPRRPSLVASSSPRTPASKPRRVAGAFSEAPAFKGEDEVLSGRDIPGEGDDVLIESPTGDSTLRLSNKVGEGGEGIVYEVEAGRVVKIFDQEHLTRHREEKIRLLVSRGIDREGICAPQAVVKNLDGDFVGYVMPKVEGRELSKAIFNPRRFKQEFAAWTKADLVDVGISFLERVSYLHSLNIILGDINPKNLLVDADKNVWIIDADSWQLEGYPCPVGTEMFSAPQVIGTRYADFLRTIEDERFAVATMLFMILITGQFPYARSGSDGDITRLIKEGNFAFQYKENSNQDQPAGNWKYMWSHIQPGVKALFWNTFHRDGDRYDARPTDEEWLQAFRRYRQHLGSSQSFDPMSNDVYPTRFKAMEADTPIYECAGCKTSMVGIWSPKTKTYATPKFCQDCKSNLPTCQDCGKHKSSLKDGVCWDCNRKRNFSTCVSCGREKPTTSLIDGRCYDCNQGTCASCGRAIRRQYLVNGVCDRCQPVPCRDCGTLTKKSDLSYGRCKACRAKDNTLDPTRMCDRCGKPFITYGNIAWHVRQGKSVPTTHQYNDVNCLAPTSTYSRTRTTSTYSSTPVISTAKCKDCGAMVPRSEMSYGRCKVCQARDNALDPSRKCARCGQPFITYGNVSWHQRMGKPVPTTHKNYSDCTVTKTPSKAPAKASSSGCFVATAVYGSYDCPEVWVLRRWRDSALLKSRAGTVFVCVYYAASPHLVAAFGSKNWFARLFRRPLDELVKHLRQAGFADLPYRDPDRD